MAELVKVRKQSQLDKYYIYVYLNDNFRHTAK